jgi:hypothetical protein
MVMMSPTSRGLSLRAHFGANKHADALATLYFALFTTDPYVSGVEPSSAGAYGRAAVANAAGLWPSNIPLGSVQISNQADIVFPTATGVYSTGGTHLTYWGIMSSPTLGSGTLWYAGRMSADVLVLGAGDQPRIIAGALTIFQGG